MADIRNSSGHAGTTLTTFHSVMRLMNGRLVVSNCTLDFVMGLAAGQDKKLQSRLIGHMKLWLDNVFDGSILIPVNRDYDPAMFANLGNNLVFCPDDPYDFVVQVLIHSKLNAIGSGIVAIDRSHLSSEQGQGFGTWFDGDPDELLPLQKDWMGDRCYFEQPWWHRSDGSTIDIMASDEDDISQKPDILLDLDDLYRRNDDDAGDAKAEIIRPNFKPKIVKDD